MLAIFPALITVVCFATSAVFGRRSTQVINSLWANFLRLGLATFLLGIISLVVAPGLPPADVGMLYLFSGVIGFGFGDIALFLAFTRLGSRLTILLMLCSAPVFGAVGDWFLLGDAVTWREALAIAVVLAGVLTAISGRFSHTFAYRQVPLGIAAAILAGLGQAWGTVITRQANDLSLELGVSVHSVSQAFQRCTGGWVVVGIVLVVLKLTWRRPIVFWVNDDSRRTPQAMFWIVGAAITGPIAGVSCYQWAIKSLDNSALVLGLTALTPIAMIPLAWWLDNDKPTPRSMIGALIAISGVIAIGLWRE